MNTLDQPLIWIPLAGVILAMLPVLRPGRTPGGVRPAMLGIVGMLCTLLTGCGKGWQLDYAEPAAQFVQEDVASKASGFIGKKITIKGTVTKVDVSTPDSARIYLANGIECNLGKFKAMAESAKVGETLFVDGFLERCAPGNVLLDPAMRRDPRAPFTPK